MGPRRAQQLKPALLSAYVAARTFALAATTTTAAVRTATATAATRTVPATTATAITTAATATTEGTAAAATRRAGLLLFSFVHTKGAAAEVHAVELLCGLHRVFRIFEVDKREAARATRHPIRREEDFANRAGL